MNTRESTKVEDYLAGLEQRLRRTAGRRHAANVVTELRGHLAESVSHLVSEGLAKVDAEEIAIASLGSVDPKEHIPTDGAPTWLNRVVRGKYSFWFCFLVVSAASWTTYVEFPSRGPWVVWSLLGVSLAVLSVLGCFGARWTALAALKAAVASLVLNSILMSFFFVNVQHLGYPLLQLRSQARVENDASLALWNSMGRPSPADLDVLARVSNFYQVPHPDPAKLPKAGHGSKGQFRYPTDDRRHWNSETPDFAFASKQWKERGYGLVASMGAAVNKHDEVTVAREKALTQPWTYNLKSVVLATLATLIVSTLWFTLSALVGDIVRSTALLLFRIFRGRWFRPTPG